MKIDPEALGRRFGEVRMSWLLGGWLLLVAAIALNRGVALLWGMVWLLAAAWACSAFVDVRLGATGHVILVTAVFGLVMLFVRPWQAALR